MNHLLIILLLILFCPPVANAQQSSAVSTNPVQLLNFVTDETGTLSPGEIQSLNQKLVDFEKSTSNQLVVYMISTLDGEPIENVSMSIAEKNLIGQKGKDNGVLLLIAKDDKKLRIEVGYGLEGALPDATASSIIRNDITPEFRNGDFYKGIDNGVDAIILATKGEYVADTSEKEFNIPSFIVVVLIFGFIIVMFITGIIKTIKGAGSSYTSGGSGSGYSGGFWGSGGSSSSGSSFGSFGGGGGSFGGGGASGGW